MNVADFRKTFIVLDQNGWLDCEEALAVVDWAERTNGDIVEIGCYYGRTTMLLGALGRRLHCIDPWDDLFSTTSTGDKTLDAFQRNIKSLNVPVEIYRMRIENWTPVPAGFVYCDGEHTYRGTKNQIAAALQCQPQVIAVHDVNDEGEGLQVKDAALGMLGEWIERVNYRLAFWKLT